MVNNQQLTFEGAMMIVQGNKWIQLKDIERLTEFIQEQQATISALKEENIELKKLKKYCAEWIGVNEDNLYDVVR